MNIIIPVIDDDFQALIPPLSPEEKAQLEANLVAEGCRDALVIWRGTILDGHNRFEICNRLDIRYQTTEISLPDKEAAADWIDRNQLGRRNLTPDQMSLLRGRRYNRTKKTKAEAGAIGGLSKGKNCTCLQSTAERIAIEHGVSPRTIKQDGKIAEWISLHPEKAELVIKGKKVLKDVKREMEREKKKKEIIAKMEAKALLPQEEVEKLLPELILADPPWQYDFAESPTREIENQYPTEPVEKIAKDKPVTNKNCILFMWATTPKLQEAMEVIEKWGFEYKTQAMWDKVIMGMGYWFRGQHELLLVATKGKAETPLEAMRVSSIFIEKRKKHSQKPECVYLWIEKTFPHLTKMEMYARRKRDGWIATGNEIL